MRLDYSAGEFHLEWQGSLVSLIRIILAFVVAYYAYWRITAVDDNAVDFTIELPEQCKKGWLESAEVLETPAIQVGEHWQLAVRYFYSCVDSWLHCHTMLRASQRQTPRSHQSHNSRRHRSRRDKSTRGTSRMGENDLLTTTKSPENTAKVRFLVISDLQHQE